MAERRLRAFSDFNLSVVNVRQHSGPFRRPYRSCLQRSVLGGTSRGFLGASARSIARSASATASDLMAVRPPTETPVSSETDHFQTCRPMPWTTVYSMPRYFMSLRIGAVFLHPDEESFRDPHPAGSR